MSILWTLLAGLVRFWSMTAHRSAARWAARSTEAGKKLDTLTTAPKGETQPAAMLRIISASDTMRTLNRAEAKYTRKQQLAERLDRIHGWLSRPRTLAGWVAGVTALPATAGVAWLGGVDVPGLLVWAGEQLQALTPQ